MFLKTISNIINIRKKTSKSTVKIKKRTNIYLLTGINELIIIISLSILFFSLYIGLFSPISPPSFNSLIPYYVILITSFFVNKLLDVPSNTSPIEFNAPLSSTACGGDRVPFSVPLRFTGSPLTFNRRDTTLFTSSPTHFNGSYATYLATYAYPVISKGLSPFLIITELITRLF